MNQFSLPGSGTRDVLDLDTCSNVGVPGLFVYRVDQSSIIHPSNYISIGKFCHRKCWAVN